MAYTMTYSSLIEDIQKYTQIYDTKFVAEIPRFIALAEYRIAKELKMLEGKRTALSTFTAGQAYYSLPARWRQTVSVSFAEETPYETVSRTTASNVRTLVLSAAHDFEVGDPIVIYNVGGTGYNGNFTVTAITQFSVSYNNTGSNEAVTDDTSGTVMATPQSYNPIYPRSVDHCRMYWPNLAETGTPEFYGDAGNSNGSNTLIIVPTPALALPWQITYYENPEQLSDSNQQNWITQNAPEILLYGALLEASPYLQNDNRLTMWKDIYDRSMQSKGVEARDRIKDGTDNRIIGT